MFQYNGVLVKSSKGTFVALARHSVVGKVVASNLELSVREPCVRVNREVNPIAVGKETFIMIGGNYFKAGNHDFLRVARG